MIAIGLGSNQGDSIENIKKTLMIIFAQKILKSIKVSPLYNSQALLPPNAPIDWNIPFVNLVIIGESDLSPQEALRSFKTIEGSLHRNSTEKWAPRPIDIDILFWNDRILKEENLTIPHPEFFVRPFALLPLCDLAPYFIPPGQDKTLEELAKKWKPRAPLGTKKCVTPHTKLVGILNATPDSFSDGGKFQDVTSALIRVGEFVDEGYRIIDIGTESTRPGAVLLTPEEEWSRLEPILKEIIVHYPKLQLSIDTRHAIIARKCLEMGAKFINDVSALSDPDLLEVVKNYSCDLVFMHSRGIPPTSDNHISIDQDPIATILNWAKTKIDEFERKKIDPESLIFDPGIGFGKTQEQNYQILSRINEFRPLGLKILVGHSRKSFMKAIERNSSATDRDPQTSCLTFNLACKGIDYIRVHHPQQNRMALEAAALTEGVYL